MTLARTGSGSESEITFTVYHIPLSVVQSWPPANTIDPDTRHWFVPYAATLQGLSTIVVGVRIWTRARMHGGGFGADDILIVLGWICATAHFTTGVYNVMAAGLDRHPWDISPDEHVKSALVGWISTMLFITSMSFIKTSVLLFFLRLLDRGHRGRLYYASIAGIIFVALCFVAFLFVAIFACKPVEAVYKAMDLNWSHEYKCAPRELSDLFNGVFSILTDVYSVMLPVFIVRGLQMSRARKAMLYLVLCCSLVVIGASIVRTVVNRRMYTDPRGDVTWIGYDLTVWSTLELQLALICASAPAVKGFLSKVSSRMTSHGSRARDGGSQRSPWATMERTGTFNASGTSGPTRNSFFRQVSSTKQPNVELESLEELYTVQHHKDIP